MFLKYAVTFLIKIHLTEVYAVPKCAHANYAITNVQITHAVSTGSPIPLQVLTFKLRPFNNLKSPFSP